jgi:hypothetical protein
LSNTTETKSTELKYPHRAIAKHRHKPVNKQLYDESMFEESTTAEFVDMVKDSKTMKFIDEALRKHYLLTTLTKEMRLELIE